MKSIKDIKVSAINYKHILDGNKNTFKIISAKDWFQTGKHDLGGVVVLIGVSDGRCFFYQNVLGIENYMILNAL
jgi:hypothetical protein